ncbi:hypothetical protein [Xylanibacter ruminicola]|uniref:hypothetical protein n=1 Tax=Xylanibacter ruminicola TaxID=839 RepID=UPI00031CAC9B|nr:hypothetical protein [Xylanibacter ruminicola]SEI02314.1 hypothetical protein SAMN02745192_2999 [Xylanibacter ruminicola]
MKQKQEIAPLLQHTLDVGRCCATAKSWGSSDLFGKVFQFYSLTCVAAKTMDEVEHEMHGTMLNLYPMDYSLLSVEVKGMLSMWDQVMSISPILKHRDYLKYPPVELDDIQSVRDKYKGVEQLVDGGMISGLFIDLCDYVYKMYDIIRLGLNTIFEKLCNLARDVKMLEENSELRVKRWLCMERTYKEVSWENDREKFLRAINHYVAMHGNTKQTLENFLHYVDVIAVNRQPKLLGLLNEHYLNGDNYVMFVFANRDQFTNDDIIRHMTFRNCRKLLLQQIEHFDLQQPVPGAYGDLFTCRAAQELTELLVPTIATYVDFKHGYQYAAWAMAMMDMKLIHADKRNSVQIMHFVNKHFGEQIDSATTLSRWTGKLFGARFGTLDICNLEKSGYTIEEFNKMQDFYWHSLSIINKVLGRNLQTENFAAYLYKEHSNVPDLKNYIDNGNEQFLDRLETLKQALNGMQP